MTYIQSNLKFLRNKMNISQEELAKRLFVTHQTVSNHENGKSLPNFEMIEKYASFFNVPFEDLIHKDLSLKQKPTRILFDSIIFDTKDKVFIILDGSKGTYSYKNIKKCEILNEKARFRGKEKPFTHQVVTGVDWMIAANFMEQPFYVGLRITMKDDTQLVVYISKNPTRTQTDQHIKAFQEAEKIKHLIDRIINKYQLESGPVTVNKKESTFTIHSGDCGVYPLNELVKCSVVFEKARDAKHNKPFARQMLVSPMTQGFAGIYSLHIGLQFTFKNSDTKYAYVSEKAVQPYSDEYRKIHLQAQQMRKGIVKLISH